MDSYFDIIEFEVLKILLDAPVDLENEYGYIISDLELVNPRSEDSSIYIGSYNIYNAMCYVNDVLVNQLDKKHAYSYGLYKSLTNCDNNNMLENVIFNIYEKIIESLEKRNIVRIKPEVQRLNFEVINGGKERSENL